MTARTKDEGRRTKARLLRALCLSFVLLPSTFVLAFAAGERTVQCVVVALAGKVTVLRAGAKAPVAAKKGDFIYEGDSIVTGPDSLAAIALTGGAEVRINAQTTFKLGGSTAGGPQKTEMRQGQAWSRLLHGHAELHVNTGNAVAAVRGTEADISMREVLTVKVYEGTVDVINAFGRASLRQGQATTVSGPQAAPAPPHPMGPGEAESWQQGIASDDKSRRELLEKLSEEAAKPPEKTLKLKVDKDGEQKELRIKFKKGEQ